MSDLSVIKIGGNIINDEAKLSSFIKDFAGIEGKKILVHGGGNLATQLAKQLKIPQKIVNGRRITDAETLKVATMVYAGYINKIIIAALQSEGCNALGVSGADGNAILAHKRTADSSVGDAGVDYGFVGDIDIVNVEFFKSLLEQNITVVVSPITHDQKGQLLNTNADTIAQEIAKALSCEYDVSLVYSFEKSGVLENAEDESTVVKQLSPSIYNDLKKEEKIFAGMLPKLDNAFTALDSGVKKVIIGKAEQITSTIKLQEAGTTL